MITQVTEWIICYQSAAIISNTFLEQARDEGMNAVISPKRIAPSKGWMIRNSIRLSISLRTSFYISKDGAALLQDRPKIQLPFLFHIKSGVSVCGLKSRNYTIWFDKVEYMS
jgi:hypothetical protein